MATVKQGDTVKVHYAGKLDDGTLFDTSAGREPLEFTVGGGQVIPGFDNALLSMAVGDKKEVVIPVDEAYGAHSDALVTAVPRERFPADLELELGQQLQVGLENGQHAIVMVVDITDEAVTIDANHPLAGQALTFEIELVEIV